MSFSQYILLSYETMIRRLTLTAYASVAIHTSGVKIAQRQEAQARIQPPVNHAVTG